MEKKNNYRIQVSDFSNALLNPDLEIPKDLNYKNGHPTPKRFDVYRNNVIVSLIEALKATYPSIEAIMGERNFQQIARFYASEHPPRSAIMHTYGQKFPNFIKNLPPLKNSPFLVDVAQAEKAWLIAYHALDAEPFNPETFSTFSPQETMDLCFSPHPASHLIKSKFPIGDLFDYRNGPPENGVDMETSQNLLITRPQLNVFTTVLDKADATFFELVLSGDTLGTAIGTAMELKTEFDAGQAIALLIQTGAVTSPKIKNTNSST